MANSFYSYLAYIQPNSNADIQVLKTNLEEFYSKKTFENKPTISLSNNEITLTFNNEYNFYIYLSEEKHIVEEGYELAEEGGLDWNEDTIDKEKLKSCKKRFEVWGDDDFDMDYFNDSLFIMSKIEEFSNIIILEIN